MIYGREYTQTSRDFISNDDDIEIYDNFIFNNLEGHSIIFFFLLSLGVVDEFSTKSIYYILDFFTQSKTYMSFIAYGNS